MICNNNTTFIMPTHLELYVNITFTAIITFIAIFGNITIITIFLKFKDIRNTSNAAITILSTSDLLRACLIMPLKLFNQTRFMDSEVNPVFGEPLCTLTGLVCGFTFVFSPMMLALIATIRYQIIVPWNYGAKTFTEKRFAFSVLVLVFVSMFFASLPLMGVGRFRYSQSHGICFADWCDENRTFRTVFYVINIFVVFPILVCCYIALFIVLTKNRKELLEPDQKMKKNKFESKTETNFESESRLNWCKYKFQSCIFIVNKTRTGYEQNINSRTVSVIELNAKTQETNSEDDHVVSPPLRKHSSENVLTDSGNIIPDNLFRREKRITRIVFMIFVAYCVCWLPAAIVNVLAIWDIFLPPIEVFYIIITMVEMKIAVDPLLYGLGNPAYWNKFKLLIFKRSFV